ncbi:unnamed protein product [Heligmosomoides polygyrus]|uniref:MULE domain-containing protein n=1 Tax=Heligmosomoides polygyrus TaxID=6339 RepID=A0A183GLA1_HELPZ|nr:unnamed protein product [Heligmosomoides polygyrus]
MSHRANTANESVTNLVLEPQIAELYGKSTENVFMKSKQEWRNDATHANSKPLGEYKKLLDDINDSYDLSMNIACHSGEAVSMLHVLDAPALHVNNAPFLQVQSPELHIYYKVDTIELACRNGLGALVADGMFSMHSDVKEKNGQLYTIHYTCQAHVLLLHAITDRKTQSTYRAIFRELEGVLARMPGGYNRELRIMLEFEKAAIKAAKITFPTASIEAFDLARAWNRKRNQLGTREYLSTHDLYPRVPALTQVPVSSDHPAYQMCRSFLNSF